MISKEEKKKRIIPMDGFLGGAEGRAAQHKVHHFVLQDTQQSVKAVVTNKPVDLDGAGLTLV